MNAYKEDLAYIHDVGHGFHAEGAAPVLLEMFRAAGFTSGLVVDLGCGSGIWARRLADAGYDVLGIDISPAMIDIARQRVPEAEFRNESLLTAKIPSCVAVTSLGECFNYLFDPRNSNASSRQRVFRRVHQALQPGGLFVFDVATIGRGAGGTQKHRVGNDWAVLSEIEEDERTQRLTRRITSFRKQGENYRRDDEVHELQLFDRDELAAELRDIGFRVRTLRSYGDYRFPKGYAGFVARRPRVPRNAK